MPQLMPLSWDVSIFVLFMLIFMMNLWFSFSEMIMEVSEMKELKKKSWWLW